MSDAPGPRDSAPQSIRLLGLDFATLEVAAAAAWLASRPASAPFAYVVTPNADHIVRLARRPALQPIYDAALLRLLDSRIVALVARGLRLPVPSVATGADLTARLLLHHLQPGEPVTIIGLEPRWLPALVRRCGLAPPAHYDPPHGFATDPALLAATVAFVRAHPTRFICLAVGSPQQEILAAAITAAGGVSGTGLCIGASLAFLAGAARRAPVWMQRCGLEWAFRLAQEPRRLARRYLRDCPAVLPMLLRERWRQ